VEQKKNWQMDASHPAEYHACETRRGREFIVRMTTGADPVLAIEKFAKEHNIRFGKVHATFMGAFKPCKYNVWTPNTENPELCSIGGMIGQRPDGKGGEEPFVAMHFVAGGAWDTAIFGGHMMKGTKVFGCMQVFVTELLDIDVLVPVDEFGIAYTFPENWYKNIAGINIKKEDKK